MKNNIDIFNQTLSNVRSCTHCLSSLSHGVRPVLQMSPTARILIAGQAPGAKVHTTGIPFDDPSGDRLRMWMGIDKACFYDATKIAILPMGFCYPGKGKSGDLPPKKECAELWRQQLLGLMPEIQLVLLIGQHAIHWHIPDTKKQTLSTTVKEWRKYGPVNMPLPHPSPRNNIWLKNNRWFEEDVLPFINGKVKALI